jgi:Ca-activated chloride channel family protein
MRTIILTGRRVGETDLGTIIGGVMRIADPAWLALGLLAVLPWIWGRRRARVAWPTLDGFGASPSRFASFARALPWLLRGSAIVFLAVAVARPRSPRGFIRVAGRGVAIIALVDRSSSMNAVDFPSPEGPISRLEAAKSTLARFVRARSDDLVGIVEFANYPDLDAPPTLDQWALLGAIGAIRPAGALDDGTNLGDAIARGLGAIRGAPTRKKVLILLTDGRNAPAVPKPVDPEAAAKLARELGVTLHTIAVGQPSAPNPTDPKTPGPESDGPDLALLARLAELGGGRSFEAADAEALGRVFDEVDALEKSPVSGTVRVLYRERFAPWASAALGLLALDLVVGSGRFRRLP